jgi:cardiolipin synthase
MQGYVRILNEAKRYVYMQTPYFLPTEPVFFAMQTAALAGVDVRLMIPRRTDNHFLDWASRTYVNDAVIAGVKIYLYEAGFLHSKLLVSDDSLSTCGSTNVDFRSFENNLEVNAFFYDEGMALRIKNVFLRDMKESFLLNDAMSHKRPFLFRLWESVVRVISPLL